VRSTDRKASHVPENHRRVLTIHDGARLTPALVAVLSVLSEHAEELVAERISDELDSIPSPSRYQRAEAGRTARSELRPVLVARSDGLAVYAPRRVL
jgi:hypothetical protein